MRRPLAIATVLTLAIAANAQASRAPTKGEAREIKAGALLSLQGSGWRVSHIRVSTVSSHYSKAAVQQGANGAAGEMILKLRHGIWHQIFLGQNDFCAVSAPKSVLDDLGFRC